MPHCADASWLISTRSAAYGMADLLSFSLTDFLPFSRATYLRLFELYDARFWPVVAVGTMLGLGMMWPLLPIAASVAVGAAVAQVRGEES